MILGSVVLKLNVQAILYSDFHFDGIIDFRDVLEDVHPKVLLEGDVGN